MDETLRERYGYLPYFLRLVLETAGEDTMLRLTVKCGGIRIFAGSNTDTTGLSDDDAALVRAILKREHLLFVDVPVASNALYQARLYRVAELRRQGASLADIAQQMGMTQRSVSRVLKRARDQMGLGIKPVPTPDHRQLNLF